MSDQPVYDIDPFARITSFHFNNNPLTVVLTHFFLNKKLDGIVVASSRQTYRQTKSTNLYLVAFADNVAAIVQVDQADPCHINLKPADPVDAAVPDDQNYDPAAALAPQWGAHGSGYDFTKPVKLVSTPLITCNLFDPGTDSLSAVNQLFDSQVMGDIGYLSYADILDQVSAGTSKATISAYTGGSFLITPSGQANPGIANTGGALRWTDSRTFSCTANGVLAQFNKDGFV